MNQDSAHYHDSEVYQDRENTKKQNANLFLSNNANPFLISPYNFPSLAAYAKNDVVSDISSIISSIVASLAAVIDLNTYTLTISSITPINSILDPNQQIRMIGDTLQFTAFDTLFVSSVNAMSIASGSTLTITSPLTSVSNVLRV